MPQLVGSNTVSSHSRLLSFLTCFFNRQTLATPHPSFLYVDSVISILFLRSRAIPRLLDGLEGQRESRGERAVRGEILSLAEFRRDVLMSGRYQFWKLGVWLGVLAVLTFVSGPLHAQSQAITAPLAGAIPDPGGLSVSDAKVTLISPDRGISRTASTESTGLYSFTLLPPAVYVLEVEAKG